MDIPMIREMGRQRVEDAKFSPKRLALIFSGVSVTVSLLLTLVSFLLEDGMNAHGGLGGLNTRAMLELTETLLMVVTTLAIPFWNLGYTAVALKIARNETPQPKTLLEGFRVVLPAIRLFLLQILILLGVVFFGMQAGSFIYMLSPAGDKAMIFLEQMLGGLNTLDERMVWQILEVMWPLYVVIGAVVLALAIPIFYRLRLTEFSLMDGETKALKNMANSYRNMRGNCFRFFRLDLGFWWYYVLQALAVALAYGDLLIPGDVAYWAFYVASCAFQVAVAYYFLPRVMTTYAVAYDEIIKKEQTC